MTDRPIPFSAPMIRAMLNGRKTQTRRVLKEQPTGGIGPWPIARVPGGARDFEWRSKFGRHVGYVRLPCSSGDRLWVREAWKHVDTIYSTGEKKCWYAADARCVYYSSANPDLDGKKVAWSPPINMPRWASRLTLIVEDVRVQRLQDISEADAEAEGVFAHVATHSIDKVFRSARAETAKQYFAELWNGLHGPGAWEANPWVVAVSFEALEANIDSLPAESPQ